MPNRANKALLGFLVGFAAFQLPNSEAVADEGIWTPQVCLGYDPDRKTWGAKGLDDAIADDFCPRNFAFVATTVPSGPPRETQFIKLGGFCCRLPNGALTDEETFVNEVCPAGYVGTGIRREPPQVQQSEDKPRRLIRCTKLDETHYAVGAASPGQMIDVAEEYPIMLRDKWLPFLYGEYRERLNWASLPAAVRYSIGRLSLTDWNWEACLGVPAGSIFVGRTSKYCRDFQFRELLRVEPGAAPTAVSLFPKCSAIDDIFSVNARCVQ